MTGSAGGTMRVEAPGQVRDGLALGGTVNGESPGGPDLIRGAGDGGTTRA